jgi:hypothetical protein
MILALFQLIDDLLGLKMQNSETQEMRSPAAKKANQSESSPAKPRYIHHCLPISSVVDFPHVLAALFHIKVDAIVKAPFNGMCSKSVESSCASSIGVISDMSADV